MPKFYDYLVSEELSKNPYTTPPANITTNWSLYFSEETLGHTINASRGGIDMILGSVASKFKVFCNAAAGKTAIKDEYVLTLYNDCQIQFPM